MMAGIIKKKGLTEANHLISKEIDINAENPNENKRITQISNLGHNEGRESQITAVGNVNNQTETLNDKSKHNNRISDIANLVKRRGTEDDHKKLDKSQEMPKDLDSIGLLAGIIKKKGNEQQVLERDNTKKTDAKEDRAKSIDKAIKNGPSMIDQMAELVKKRGETKLSRHERLNDSLEMRGADKVTPVAGDAQKISEECQHLRTEVSKLRNRVNELENKDQKQEKPLKLRSYGQSDTNVNRTVDYQSLGSRNRNYDIPSRDLNESINLDRNRISHIQYHSSEKPRSDARTTNLQSDSTFRDDPVRSAQNSNSKYQTRPTLHNTASHFREQETHHTGRDTVKFGEQRTGDSFFYKRPYERAGPKASAGFSAGTAGRPSETRPQYGVGAPTSEIFFGNFKELRLQRFESFHQKLSELMKELRVPEAMSEPHSQETTLKNQWRFIKSLVTGMSEASRQRRDNEARAPQTHSANKPRMLRYN